MSLLRGTRLISIKADATRSARGGRLAERNPGRIPGGSVRDASIRLASEANSFLLSEVKRLAAKLQASKQALQDYREKTKAVSLEESKNITDARLRS